MRGPSFLLFICHKKRKRLNRFFSYNGLYAKIVLYKWGDTCYEKE